MYTGQLQMIRIKQRLEAMLLKEPTTMVENHIIMNHFNLGGGGLLIISMYGADGISAGAHNTALEMRKNTTRREIISAIMIEVVKLMVITEKDGHISTILIQGGLQDTFMKTQRYNASTNGAKRTHPLLVIRWTLQEEQARHKFSSIVRHHLPNT